MTTQEIAQQLVAYCAKGEFEKAQTELYAADAVSIEPYATPDFAKETKGLPELQRKIKAFLDGLDAVHSIKVSEPLVVANAISFTIDMDVDMKGQGRMNMAEICVYEVRDGKVISEQFFF
ncbi:SnoaL-like domain-containing protein [Chitinophaga sancti]|uniref:SnoaL-like domain-containing protein n=1 Tax=Chitinophaga sancti TaxID=1004 RepID=A0A1K1S8D6_9BACT|nr:SnoaL-like domain-containing protein [Chitinophaga sancti]WQD60989.1 SnoaL-like domain-containing protein [Chitinophaga sancti]WQG86884.1 SnoaL-like domain-containing protein [Chitinophaga sancti]SFW80619.1 hypothetical protein SAMN05661012_04953 [Chitinophaga sancti]